MQNDSLKVCLTVLQQNRSWDTSGGSEISKLIPKILSELETNLPSNWYIPLVKGLESSNWMLIKTILSTLSDIYCSQKLNFITADKKPFLAVISNIVASFSKQIYAQVAYQIVRFCLGVINGESDESSAVHKEVLLDYFNAIFQCAIYASERKDKDSARTALTQVVQIVCQRFESPPAFHTEASLLAYRVSHKICFSAISNELFDILDNSSLISNTVSVYESDVLLLLRSLCTGSLSTEAEGTTALETAMVSIELVNSIISMDKEVMYTSLRYLQLIKNMTCSLVLRYSHTSSYPVFRATLGLCHSLMVRYREMLKAEISVFFSTLFFRVLDQQSPIVFKLAVIDRLMCFTPSFLAEIFVNFDCDSDLQEANVFEHLMNSLISMSDNIDALHCIAEIMRKLNDWSNQTTAKKKTKSSMYFEKTRKLKAIYAKAIDDFNADAEHNMKALIECGLVKDDAKSIAAFFHSHRALLNPTGVGLILGSTKDLFKQVMHEYVDSIDFTQMSLCEALYAFLSMFRLPPESQQISRILEKFAHSYYLAHEKDFPSAEIVYDASFAAVILHTDAHNVQVKNKMQKHEFVKLYQDMDEGDCLSVQFIEDMYDYVVSHEISLLGTPQSVTMTEDFRSPTRKGLDSYKQSIEYIREAQKRMRSSPGSEIKWISPVNPDTVRSMFDAIWMPLNALASKILGDGGSEEVISSALTILTASIAISARFYMETESTVCMSSLCVFTRLQPWTPIQVQNIRAIRRLLDMSTSFSLYFEPVWERMLMLFAHMNYFMLAHNTSMPGDQKLEEIARRNAEIVAAFVPIESIDALFEASSQFPSTAIVPFVNALCKVSNNELSQRPPRTFCLQKIVEVTLFNMERARFVWSQIWKPISQHLIDAGCFPQEVIARTALDSLRQLAGKFLAREEFQTFHYQRDFLKPFHLILRKSKSKSIRLHALRCLNYTVNMHHANMKSGWQTVFTTLESAATIAEVNRLALTVLIDICEEHTQCIMEERALPLVIRALQKFVLVGRSIRVSAIYVMVGILDTLLKINTPDRELDVVVSALAGVMNEVDAVNYALPVLKAAKIEKWELMAKYLGKVITNKNENWYIKGGNDLAEWAITTCAESDPETAVTLVLECLKCRNANVLSICVRTLTGKLMNIQSTKDAVASIIGDIITVISKDPSKEQLALECNLACDLVGILSQKELKSLLEVTEKLSEDNAKIARRCVLCLSITLFENNCMDESKLKQLCKSTFDNDDDGRLIVVRELMKLGDEKFVQIAKAISVEAAADIKTENEELRKSLTDFFVRMSKDCFSSETTK